MRQGVSGQMAKKRPKKRAPALLLIGIGWTITTVVAAGIFLWGWDPVLIAIVPMFSFPVIDMALTWLVSDKRRWNRTRADHHRRHAAGAH